MLNTSIEMLETDVMIIRRENNVTIHVDLWAVTHLLKGQDSAFVFLNSAENTEIFCKFENTESCDKNFALMLRWWHTALANKRES